MKANLPQEDFLHYLWRTQSFNTNGLILNSGAHLIVLNQGQYNIDSGPDFKNAKIKIGQTLWYGHIEIHVKSSDWYKHHHESDPSFYNVILHVVYEHDCEIRLPNGEILDTLELKQIIHPSLLLHYYSLKQSSKAISCYRQLSHVDRVFIKSAIHSQAIFRLEKKVSHLKGRLVQLHYDWELLFYQELMKAMGGRVNKENFLTLAIKIPILLIKKYKNQPEVLDALFFGQSGLIPDKPTELYVQNLKKDYSHLKKKHQLKPMDKFVWQFSKMRPSGFPTHRIAQVSRLLSSSCIFQTYHDVYSIIQLKRFFSINLNPFWFNHFHFKKTTTSQPNKNIGESHIEKIIINVISPFAYLYGKHQGLNHLIDWSLSLLESCKSEKNREINQWINLGIKPVNALETQGLLSLKKELCEKGRCTECKIGNQILKKR